VEDFVAWYMDNIDTHTEIFPHVEDILQTAQKANIGLAVVTNKRFDLSEKLLTRLGLLKYFGTLVAGDTLPTRKPDPGMIYEALKRLDGDPSQTIRVGDSAADTQAAQNAGIPCICVTFGYSLEPVQSLGAEAVIDDYETFYDIVTTLRPIMGHRLSKISH
ncbi:MAG: HAD-IIIA family hydrolase, partial [Pseudomonadota bacterium]|nr:HAD-IIIA family hydrolase [Pseudomonadota bacterium]